MTLLPTPTSRDHKGHNQRGDTSCLTGALLPTPAAARSGRQRSASPGATIRPSLDSITQLLPTPRAARGASATETMELLPTPNAALGRGAGTPSAETAQRRRAEGRRFLDDAVALLPTPRATDGTKGGPNQRGSSGDLMLPSAVVQLLPTPTVADSRGSRNATAGRSTTKPSTHSDGWTLSDVAYADRWGEYGPAIARWEAITGQAAPDATEPGTKGQPRLAPTFVEWLMGLPAGWVTDRLGRGPALKALGNGVVWQQAAHAYTELLAAA